MGDTGLSFSVNLLIEKIILGDCYMGKKFLVIGLTGGIGSGKSEVAKYLAAKGIPVISSDDNAKIIMAEDKALQDEIKTIFGDDAYLDDGSLNRKFLADKVFGSDKESQANLEKLNRLVHPRTIEMMVDMVDIYRKEGKELVFVESALIYEIGIDDGFDYVIAVDAKTDIKTKRLMQRSNMSEADIKYRMSRQLSSEEQLKRADFSIENNGTIDQLHSSVDFLLDIITELPPKEFE